MDQDNYTTLSNSSNCAEQCQKLGFSKLAQELIQHVIRSITAASNDTSNLSLINNETTQYVLEYDGYTGTRTRHFYNNVCSKPGSRLLEIGTWTGSSSMSFMYANKINAVFIDNWSQFNGNKSLLVDNLEKVTMIGSEYRMIESDCWKVDVKSLGKFDVYLYDGDHSEEDHFQALNYYIDCLDDTFLFIVDDNMWPNVRDGTMRAIKMLNLKILFRHEIFLSPEDLLNMPNHKGRQTWWNGIGIFVLQKYA
jgi:hypothetical protein